MKIDSVTLHRVQIPLRNRFAHATAVRDRTDNVVCVVALGSGTRGFGEGVPRSYVTGESVDTMWRTIAAAAASLQPASVASVEDGMRYASEVVAAITDVTPIVHNAARCALELALLDAIGRELRCPLARSLSAYVGARPATVCRHSLVADHELAADLSRLQELKQRYGFRAVKLKVGFGEREDLTAIRQIRSAFGSDAEIRLDANRAWDAKQAISFMRQARLLGVCSIEDPVAGETIDEQAEGLRALRRESVEVILDETIRTGSEAEHAMGQQLVDVLNIRVSKNGGLINSARIAAMAQQRGVGIQVGCQVGETAILSAAGRVLAHAAGPVRYYEGSNEQLKFEPAHYLSEEDLSYDATARSGPLNGPGLGITVRSDRLDAFSIDAATIDLG